MNRDASSTIQLTEYQTKLCTADALNAEHARLIWEQYGNQVDVVAPSFRHPEHWQLTPKGWVGQVPISESLLLILQPKVSIQNLFGMFEYAYRLRAIKFLPDLVHTDSLQQIYEQLANVLAKRVIDRSRRGLYRAYQPEQDRLPYLRGRMDIARAARSPWDAKIDCHFEEHTSDVDDNRILAWTLWRIVRSGVCTERVLPTARRAYRILQSASTLEPFSPESCVGRVYNRLNQDYQPLHALSRFFLDQSGPSHTIGNREMTPFLVDMAQLFELFVAEWLTIHAPKHWRIRPQKRLYFGQEKRRYFQPDIVIEDINTGGAILVLDTKYKSVDQPSESDIQQMMTYAYLLDCHEAVLIYPELPASSLMYNLNGIRVHSLSFLISNDLDTEGQHLLDRLQGLAHNE